MLVAWFDAAWNGYVLGISWHLAVRAIGARSVIVEDACFDL